MQPQQIQTLDNNNDALVLRDVLRKYLRYWYWFVISIVVCMAVAFIYLKTQSPKYNVSSKIMIRGEEGDGGGAESGMLQSLGIITGSKHVNDELHIIGSKTLMQQVIRTLDIQTSYFKYVGWTKVEEYPLHTIDIRYPEQFCDTMKSGVNLRIEKTSDGYHLQLKYAGEKYKYDVKTLEQPLKMPFGNISLLVNKPLNKGDEFQILTPSLPSLVESMQAGINAQQVNDESNVVTISTTSPTPRKAIDILDKLVELYNADAVIDKNLLATATGRFIDDRLRLITEELSDVEQDVEAYKKSQQLTDISSEANLYLTQASTYQRQLADLETQLNLVNYVEEYISSSDNQYALIPANLGIEDPSLQNLVGEYNKLILDRMKLSRSATDNSPVIVQTDERLATMRSSLHESIRNIKAGIDITKRNAQNRDRQFVNRIKNVPTQEREYVEIKRQQQIKETLYLFLYQKREENALALASTVQPAKTIDRADYDRKPVAPKNMTILLIALLAGLIIPVAFLLVYDLIFDQVTDKKDFTTKLKAPFVGEISKSKSESRVVVVENRSSSISELFRMLRTNITFMIQGKKCPVVVVTSSYTGEGKSFVSVNLAASLALMNKRVLLVGLDVRNPKLAHYLELDRTGHLTEYLAGEDLEDELLVFPTSVNENLFVAPAGAVPPNPGELILSQRLDEIVERWRSEYDIIIIDSAPVGVVSDTYLLNRLSDMTLYVSRAKYTPRSSVDFINEQYEQKKLNNMACVLNDVDRKSVYGGYYYYNGRRRSGKYYSYIND